MEHGGRIELEAALVEQIASELRAAARFHEQNGNDAVAEALRMDARRHAREAVMLRARADTPALVPA
ncbi:hypothetical protein U8607_11625 [Methylobacterium durans]|uniref:hypothetical protein n=1 Tax=Methylobacterium durans TaxID=2202825 RepID=UPI002AFF5FDD|nr:hypothetical protein [Methylobacterium durans]MEA1832732.1 hypothetical protein [Methylobacterium durans]